MIQIFIHQRCLCFYIDVFKSNYSEFYYTINLVPILICKKNTSYRLYLE